MNIAVLISGYGSNLKAIIEHIKIKNLPINICGVVSNKANAYGLEIAKQHNINTNIVNSSKNSSVTLERSLLEVINPLKPDWIILAGFMRILSAEFVSQYKNKIINIHPSLLPKYPGLNTHKKVLENQDREHGCTVHIVTEELDAGPIIGQSRCMVNLTDTEEELKAKVQKLEHALYPKIVEDLLAYKKIN